LIAEFPGMGMIFNSSDELQLPTWVPTLQNSIPHRAASGPKYALPFRRLIPKLSSIANIYKVFTAEKNI
jgi:hypothetical protein